MEGRSKGEGGRRDRREGKGGFWSYTRFLGKGTTAALPPPCSSSSFFLPLAPKPFAPGWILGQLFLSFASTSCSLSCRFHFLLSPHFLKSARRRNLWRCLHRHPNEKQPHDRTTASSFMLLRLLLPLKPHLYSLSCTQPQPSHVFPCSSSSDGGFIKTLREISTNIRRAVV